MARSTTAESDVALQTFSCWPEAPAVLFEVQVFNATCLSGHSVFPAEDEIILLPGTQMVVTETEDLNLAPKVLKVRLTQVQGTAFIS